MEKTSSGPVQHLLAPQYWSEPTPNRTSMAFLGIFQQIGALYFVGPILLQNIDVLMTVNSENFTMVSR